MTGHLYPYSRGVHSDRATHRHLKQSTAYEAGGRRGREGERGGRKERGGGEKGKEGGKTTVSESDTAPVPVNKLH